MYSIEKKLPKVRGLNVVKKSPYKENSLIIGISVGSEKFEGTLFLALIKSINELFELGKVTDCKFHLADTLQRYNYMIDGKTSERDAFLMSQKAGDEWITRHIEILTCLKLPYKIIRWNKWLNSGEQFIEAFSRVSSLADNLAFEAAILNSIAEFSSRFKKRYENLKMNNPINDEALQKSCRSYLLEECAIIMKLWPIYKKNVCQYLLYPGKMTEALSRTYEDVVEQKKIFKWVKFYFKTRPLINTEAIFPIPAESKNKKLDTAFVSGRFRRRIFSSPSTFFPYKPSIQKHLDDFQALLTTKECHF